MVVLYTDMRNPFAGLMSLFSRGAESVVGLDFGASAVKAVQLKKKNGQAVLETYGAVALAPYAGSEVGRGTRLPTDKLAEALSDLLREAKVTAHAVGCAIPLSESLAVAIVLPTPRDTDSQGSAGNPDISGLIRLEARKYVPTPLSEVELEWKVFSPLRQLADGGPAGAGENEALITAVHRDALVRLQGALAQAGLTPSFFELELWSAARADGFLPDAVAGFIDIGARATKILLIDQSEVRDAHTLLRGGQDVTLALATSLGIPFVEAEERKRAGSFERGGAPGATLARIFAEAREVFRRYERRHGRAVGSIALSGGGALLAGLPQMAEEALGVPAALIDPFSRLSAPAFLSPLLARAGPEFAVATGAALRALESVR